MEGKHYEKKKTDNYKLARATWDSTTSNIRFKALLLVKGDEEIRESSFEKPTSSDQLNAILTPMGNGLRKSNEGKGLF